MTQDTLNYLRTRDTDTARAMHRARTLLTSDPYNVDLMDGFRRTVRAYAHAHNALCVARST